MMGERNEGGKEGRDGAERSKNDRKIKIYLWGFFFP